MKSTILQNFYNGEHAPVEMGLTQLRHYRRADLWAFLKGELEKKFYQDPEGAKYLEKYDEMVSEVISMYREEAFLQGFRTGSQIILEIFDGEEE